MRRNFKHNSKMAVVIAFLIVIFSVSHSGAQTSDQFEIFFVEPFSTRLPENGIPVDQLSQTYPNPIQVALTPGECGSPAIISVRGKADLGVVEISPAFNRGEADLSQILFGVRLIKMIGRTTRWAHDVHHSTPSQGGVVMVPDILVYDESTFNRQLRGASGRLPLSTAPSRQVTAEIGANQTRYFLLTVRVPQNVSPGNYPTRLSINMTSRQKQIEIPIQITILNFKLPPPGKILAISNDFSSPRDRHFQISLQDLVDHGMNSTRLKNVIGRSDKQQILRELKNMGIETVIHDDMPRSGQDMDANVESPVQYFYGIDEPIPKRRSGNSWQRMADHVSRSEKIHRKSGKVATSLPFSVAMELTYEDGDLYQTLQNYGIHNLYEPLDWSNYTLAIQHLERHHRMGDRLNPDQSAHRAGTRSRRNQRGRPNPVPSGGEYRLPRTNNDLWQYIAELQADYVAGNFDETGTPVSKHDWVETSYFALGFFRSPFFARLMYGYYLFNSHLDGITTWTQYRPRGNPFSDKDGPDAVIAYPASDGMLSTFYWEAVREGVNDLRYCRAAEKLILSFKDSRPEKYTIFFKRFNAILSGYYSLMVNGVRIDKAYPRDTFRNTRQQLILLIQDMLAAGDTNS